MKFQRLPIKGSYLITHNLHNDKRGSFGRQFCFQTFKKVLKEKNIKIQQTNISFNKKRGTLRGFHYQIKRYSEIKVLTILTGCIFDIILDLRKNSHTFKKFVSINLSDKKIQSIVVPKGCANAFITKKNNTIIHYLTTKKYNPNFERGIRYDDMSFNFKWPMKPKIISAKDKSWKDYELGK